MKLEDFIIIVVLLVLSFCILLSLTIVSCVDKGILTQCVYNRFVMGF